MKIAHVCPFYTPAIGGVKQVVEELAKRQVADGHEVHVYTSDWDKAGRIEKLDEVIDGVQVHRCKHLFKVANFVSYWPSVKKKLWNCFPLSNHQIPDILCRLICSNRPSALYNPAEFMAGADAYRIGK